MPAWTLFAILAVTAAQLSRVTDPPPETSFFIEKVMFSYPGRFRALHRVNFRDLPLFVSSGGPAEPYVLPLHKGRYEYRGGFAEGFESVELEKVNYLGKDAETNDEFALVLYSHTVAGGSSNTNGIANVVERSSGALRVIQQIGWDEHFQPPGGWYSRLRNSVLTIRSARYLDGDAHCCISGMDTVTLHWTGSKFVQTGIVTERLP